MAPRLRVAFLRPVPAANYRWIPGACAAAPAAIVVSVGFRARWGRGWTVEPARAFPRFMKTANRS